MEGKSVVYPECVNGKEARMVCLSGECGLHPFFCTNCEEPSCQTQHTHDDRLASISFKQFTKRVLAPKKPIEKLSQGMQLYRQVLQKLRQDVTQFIEKQLQQLEEIEKKVSEIAQEDEILIVKLKETKYEGFTGKIMDHLWSTCVLTQQKKQGQEQTAQFIKIKQDQVKGISEHFQHLNTMDYNYANQQQQLGNKSKVEQKQSPSASLKGNPH